MFMWNHSNEANELYNITQYHWYQPLREALKTMSISEFLLYLIHDSKAAFSCTEQSNTYMIWHDRLSILWDKATQSWLCGLSCPIEDWPERTWTNRLI